MHLLRILRCIGRAKYLPELRWRFRAQTHQTVTKLERQQLPRCRPALTAGAASAGGQGGACTACRINRWLATGGPVRAQYGEYFKARKSAAACTVQHPVLVRNPSTDLLPNARNRSHASIRGAHGRCSETVPESGSDRSAARHRRTSVAVRPRVAVSIRHDPARFQDRPVPSDRPDWQLGAGRPCGQVPQIPPFRRPATHGFRQGQPPHAVAGRQWASAATLALWMRLQAACSAER
jgi:hypothetical protein